MDATRSADTDDGAVTDATDTTDTDVGGDEGLRERVIAAASALTGCPGFGVWPTADPQPR